MFRCRISINLEASFRSGALFVSPWEECNGAVSLSRVLVISTMRLMLCYRFVTRQELDSLGMSHLVGSPLLRAYMHGFFVHNKLWQKARAIAAPLEYETVRKQQIQARLEAERAQRITIKRKLPKVCGSDSCAAWQIRNPTAQAAKGAGVHARLVGGRRGGE